MGGQFVACNNEPVYAPDTQGLANQTLNLYRAKQARLACFRDKAIWQIEGDFH